MLPMLARDQISPDTRETIIEERGARNVTSIDRVARSHSDGIQIIQRVAARGALVKVLDKPYLDLTSTMGQGILAFLSALPRTSASGS